MLNDWFFAEGEAKKIENILFQQDGTTSHTAHVIIDSLRSVFEYQIISKNGDINWLQQSYD